MWIRMFWLQCLGKEDAHTDMHTCAGGPRSLFPPSDDGVDPTEDSDFPRVGCLPDVVHGKPTPAGGGGSERSGWRRGGTALAVNSSRSNRRNREGVVTGNLQIGRGRERLGTGFREGERARARGRARKKRRPPPSPSPPTSKISSKEGACCHFILGLRNEPNQTCRQRWYGIGSTRRCWRQPASAAQPGQARYFESMGSCPGMARRRTAAPRRPSESVGIFGSRYSRRIFVVFQKKEKQDKEKYRITMSCSLKFYRI